MKYKSIRSLSDGQRYPCLAGVVCDRNLGRVQSSSLEKDDDLCFHTYEEFFPSPSSDRDLSLWTRIKALGLEFGPWGWALSLKYGILASRMGFGVAEIWALRLVFGPHS